MTLFAIQLSVVDQLEPISQIGNECAKRWRPAGKARRKQRQKSNLQQRSRSLFARWVPAQKEIA
ncbi:MAG: hypothetical protein DMF38_01440 [Verrucomicrobia bacterium]|nr:MAG: hypothetical protein DMF38_01440 [Verrucomicrobiota bacterium]